MPKKFGDNTRAVAAKERKEAAKEAERTKKFQEEEDAKWKDDDKGVQKKQKRKEDLEHKKQEAQAKKAENKALLEKELADIKKPAKAAPPPKITRAQINLSKTKLVEENSELGTSKPNIEADVPLEENLNRIEVDGDEARSVAEAINLLSMKDEEVDKHPEKRMKAAFMAFQEKREPQLKEENPQLRMSQIKQIIFKEWKKSPENPLRAANN